RADLYAPDTLTSCKTYFRQKILSLTSEDADSAVEAPQMPGVFKTFDLTQPDVEAPLRDDTEAYLGRNRLDPAQISEGHFQREASNSSLESRSQAVEFNESPKVIPEDVFLMDLLAIYHNLYSLHIQLNFSQQKVVAPEIVRSHKQKFYLDHSDKYLDMTESVYDVAFWLQHNLVDDVFGKAALADHIGDALQVTQSEIQIIKNEITFNWKAAPTATKLIHELKEDLRQLASFLYVREEAFNKRQGIQGGSPIWLQLQHFLSFFNAEKSDLSGSYSALSSIATPLELRLPSTGDKPENQLLHLLAALYAHVYQEHIKRGNFDSQPYQLHFLRQYSEKANYWIEQVQGYIALSEEPLPRKPSPEEKAFSVWYLGQTRLDPLFRTFKTESVSASTVSPFNDQSGVRRFKAGEPSAVTPVVDALTAFFINLAASQESPRAYGESPAKVGNYGSVLSPASESAAPVFDQENLFKWMQGRLEIKTFAVLYFYADTSTQLDWARPRDLDAAGELLDKINQLFKQEQSSALPKAKVPMLPSSPLKPYEMPIEKELSGYGARNLEAELKVAAIGLAMAVCIQTGLRFKAVLHPIEWLNQIFKSESLEGWVHKLCEFQRAEKEKACKEGKTYSGRDSDLLQSYMSGHSDGDGVLEVLSRLFELSGQTKRPEMYFYDCFTSALISRSGKLAPSAGELTNVMTTILQAEEVKTPTFAHAVKPGAPASPASPPTQFRPQLASDPVPPGYGSSR
ncbi:MAG: hypothetical protein EBX40_02510, partial [Gammaproteobacteria bacterium]|nr:hypothetical protein [Gammaproteobacteria bacterium]